MANKNVRYYHDPVHGVITFPFALIQTVIDHPYLQRLRRISQCGLSNYVFPGATHTRFHHSLGVAHLALRVLEVLKAKGIKITDSEMESACIAALIHDIGHGPFSHALEHKILPVHHETLSLYMAEEMNSELNGVLSEAISILKKEHPKKFLSQLIASQLDVDRMDYLTRDSFYTGVEEGRLGLDRLIRTFNVAEGSLVIEKKALQTVEKFLVSRHHMYWQVYIHKAVLSIQQMLIMFIERIKNLISQGVDIKISDSLKLLLNQNILSDKKLMVRNYAYLDDISVINTLKINQNHSDKILSFICKSLLDRKIFALDWIKVEKKEYLISQKLQNILSTSPGLIDESRTLIRTGTESIDSYNLDNEIEILLSDQKVVSLSKQSDIFFKENTLSKSFICYPKDGHIC